MCLHDSSTHLASFSLTCPKSDDFMALRNTKGNTCPETWPVLTRKANCSGQREAERRHTSSQDRLPDKICSIRNDLWSHKLAPAKEGASKPETSGKRIQSLKRLRTTSHPTPAVCSMPKSKSLQPTNMWRSWCMPAANLQAHLVYWWRPQRSQKLKPNSATKPDIWAKSQQISTIQWPFSSVFFWWLQIETRSESLHVFSPKKRSHCTAGRSPASLQPPLWPLRPTLLRPTAAWRAQTSTARGTWLLGWSCGQWLGDQMKPSRSPTKDWAAARVVRKSCHEVVCGWQKSASWASPDTTTRNWWCCQYVDQHWHMDPRSSHVEHHMAPWMQPNLGATCSNFCLKHGRSSPNAKQNSGPRQKHCFLNISYRIIHTILTSKQDSP